MPRKGHRRGSSPGSISRGTSVHSVSDSFGATSRTASASRGPAASGSAQSRPQTLRKHTRTSVGTRSNQSSSASDDSSSSSADEGINPTEAWRPEKENWQLDSGVQLKKGDRGFAEDDEWEGFHDSVALESPNHEKEYIDEDRYTTVKIEAVTVDRDGLHGPDTSTEDEENVFEESKEEANGQTKPAKSRNAQARKKKKFRYESPADRKMNRAKERAKKSKQARIRRGE